MSITTPEKLARRKRRMCKRKRRIAYRLREIHWSPQDEPMFSGSNIHYEIAERTRALSAGGIGCVARWA